LELEFLSANSSYTGNCLAETEESFSVVLSRVLETIPAGENAGASQNTGHGLKIFHP